MSAPRSSRFSPYVVPEERLEALLVGRHALLARLVDDQRAAQRAGAARFDVIVAPRGSGKSHLLALAGHRLARAAAEDGFLLVRLGEEEYPSGSVDLLARVLAGMPEEEGLPRIADQLAVLRKTPRDRQASVAEGLLVARAAGRGVSLVVENLDRVLDAIGTEGQHALRALLARLGRWSVLGSSCTWGATFTGARSPFLHTFQRIALPAFSDREAHAMLLRLAEAYDDEELAAQLRAPGGYSRVRAMRFLLGGNPRAMALVFPFLRGRRLDDLEGAFFELAEELTPYYQDQMSRLPPGQRPYLEHLAASWEPLSVSELAERCFDSPQTASGQLRYLARDLLVRSHRLGREAFYELAEPLHRLAVAMKRPERAPAALARFLAVWLEREEIEIRWSAAGMLQDAGNPWFLALKGLEGEETDYDRAVVAEIEALAATGAKAEALELARRRWDERPTDRLGAFTVVHVAEAVAPDAEAVIREVWRRFPRPGAALAVLAAAWLGGVSVEPSILAAARAMVEAIDLGRFPAVALIRACEPGLDEARLESLLPLVATLDPGVVVPILGGLHRRGDPARVVALATAVGIHRLGGPARIVAFVSAMSAGLVDRLDREALRGGLRGEPHAQLELMFAVADEDADRALRLAREGWRRWPREATYPFVLGSVLSMRGAHAEAVEALRAAVALEPTVRDGWEALAGVCLAAGDLDAVLTETARAAEQGHQSDKLRNARLAALLGRRRFVELAALARERSDPYLAAIAQIADLAARAGPVEPADLKIELRVSLLADLVEGVLTQPNGLAALRLLHERQPEAIDRALALAALRAEVRQRETGAPPSAVWQAILEHFPEALAPVASLLGALRALPDDPGPFVRLAAPERAALREVLRGLGASRLLASLPTERPPEDA